MSLVNELIERRGVIAAGEFAMRGDRFYYRGHIDQEYARLLSVVCRTTSLGVRMQGELLDAATDGNNALYGWCLHGAQQRIYVVGDTFCLCRADDIDEQGIFDLMRRRRNA